LGLGRTGYLLCAGILTLALGCASSGPVTSQLRFVDSQIFEKELQNSMGAKLPQIVVGFAGRDATVSNMPDRLEKWLFVINDRDDGNVRFQADPNFMQPKSPIPIGLAFTIGAAAWKMYRNWSHYAPASDYNALVFYHPMDAYLTRVIFVRKQGADS
jgi:hypothetical protein